MILDSKSKYVQVKGLGSSNQSVKVTKSSVDGEKFDYMIIVKFESGDCNSVSLKNEFCILSLQEVDQIYQNKKSMEENSFTISKGEYWLPKHLDKWGKIS